MNKNLEKALIKGVEYYNSITLRAKIDDPKVKKSIERHQKKLKKTIGK